MTGQAAREELERLRNEIEIWALDKPSPISDHRGIEHWADNARRAVKVARAALDLAERLLKQLETAPTFRPAPPKDLGAAIPQSAVLEAGRPKPIHIDGGTP